VDVRAYGTITFGAGATAGQKTANATAIQAAINAFTNNGATILLPPGIIYIDGDVVKLNKDRIHLKGMGIHATELYFDSGVAITMAKDNTDMIVQSSISDLSLMGQGTANKVGIRITNADVPAVYRVTMSTITGNTSIGLQLRGKDLGSMTDMAIFADRPISIEDNPNSIIDIDHYSFRNMYLITEDNTQANVTIADGVNLTNVTFDGYQAWVQGKYGLYWNDTTSTIASLNLVLNNVRIEQTTDDTGYMIYISHNYLLTNLYINGLFGGVNQAGTDTTNGIYARKVKHSQVNNTQILSGAVTNDNTKIAFNVDNTCYSWLLLNVMYYTFTTNTFPQIAKIRIPNYAGEGVALAVYEESSNLPEFPDGFRLTLPTYDNNAAAYGLGENAVYKTTTGELRIVVP
jgi:hypothetical protein